MPVGLLFAGRTIVAVTVLLVVSITDIVLLCSLVTYALFFQRSRAMPQGLFPTAIVAVTALLRVFITDTELPFMFVTYALFPTYTARGVEATILPDEALIVVDPATSAVANPALLIAAIASLEDPQVTDEVMSWVVLSVYVPMAVNCCVVLRAIA